MQDFDEFIIGLVRSAEPDLDERLKEQEEALHSLQCTNETLGRWINRYDVEYLLAAFNLNDQDFAENFPEMAHLNRHDRSQIIEAFEDHFLHCSHCHLKRGYDLEMNARIESVYRKHSDSIAEQLSKDQDGPNPNQQDESNEREELDEKDVEALKREATVPKALGVGAAQHQSSSLLASLWSKRLGK